MNILDIFSLEVFILMNVYFILIGKKVNTHYF